MAVTLTAALATGTAQAAKFKVLHSFCEGQHRLCGDGSKPQASLVTDSAGNLFSTTIEGGKFDHGTAFELERKNSGAFKFKTIFRFCPTNLCQNGAAPTTALIVDTLGNLYGTANNVVFELSPSADGGEWSETALYHFCSQQNCTDGNGPLGGLTYAGASSGVPYDGVSPLYGVTNVGGANNGGTVFQLSSDGGQWTETVLYSFCSLQGVDVCMNGTTPSVGLVLDKSGNLFGTTEHGGGNDLGKNGGGAGVIYQLSPQGNLWSETVLHRFCSEDQCTDGAYPLSALILDTAGNLLGTTAVGGGKCSLNGSYGCGVIFKLFPDGEASQETVLYTFCQKKSCADGAQPSATPILDSSGNLFGTTENGGGNSIDQDAMGGGVVYALTGTSYKVLHHFCSLANCADGEYPKGNLIMDASGVLFGTTSLGGVDGGMNSGGTVFRVRP